MYIENLFERFKNGDEYAFDDLVCEYKDNLLFFITRFINSVSVAEVIAKSAFVELYKNKDRFADGSDVRAYLCAFAKHRAISLEGSPEASASDNDPLNANDLLELERKIIKSSEQKLIVDSMVGLDDDYKAVLYLVYIEEMSYAEVSKVMRIDRSRVMELIAEAKESLKNTLAY